MRKFIFSISAMIIFFASSAADAIAIGPPVGQATLYGILNSVINGSLKIILPIAVIVILVAAFVILRSNGDSSKAAEGKKILTFGLAGLAIVIIAAGSSSLLMNIFGVDKPGITSPSIEEQFNQSPEIICNNQELLSTSPELQALCEGHNNAQQCTVK
jgi:hypothetical protein